MGKHAGAKFNGRHTTAIEAAEDVIKTANKHKEATKIILGPIEQTRQGSGARRMKVKDVPAGLELTIRGGSRVQTIYVYTQNQHGVASALDEAFNKR